MNCRTVVFLFVCGLVAGFGGAGLVLCALGECARAEPLISESQTPTELDAGIIIQPDGSIEIDGEPQGLAAYRFDGPDEPLGSDVDSIVYTGWAFDFDYLTVISGGEEWKPFIEEGGALRFRRIDEPKPQGEEH